VTLGEWAEFGHGGATYPLKNSGVVATPLLAVADPALYAAIEFFSAVIEMQLGAALRTYAAADGVVIQNAVLTKANIEPVPVIYADQTRFPFFAIYRTSEVQTQHTRVWDKSIAQWEFAYVLPSLMPKVQPRLAPILRAVTRVMAKAARMGWHPKYQSGRDVWKDAGLMSMKLTAARYERYERINDPVTSQQFFRAVIGTIEAVERDMPVPEAFPAFAGGDLTIVEPTIDPGPEPIVNPSFELDFAGWTLSRLSTHPPQGGASIVAPGQHIDVGLTLHDYVSGGERTLIDSASPQIHIDPIVAPNSAGAKCALLWMQGDADVVQATQLITIPTTATTLSWRQSFSVHFIDMDVPEWVASLGDSNQSLRVLLYDHDTNARLATLWRMYAPDGVFAENDILHTVDVTAFRGQTVRLELSLVAYVGSALWAIDDFVFDRPDDGATHFITPAGDQLVTPSGDFLVAN
jgi:hypothetical protein